MHATTEFDGAKEGSCEGLALGAADADNVGEAVSSTSEGISVGPLEGEIGAADGETVGDSEVTCEGVSEG